MAPLRSVTLTSPGATVVAELVPDANLLCRSLTYRGTELLGQGHGLTAYVEHGKTMGIPLAHPWINRLSSYTYEVAGRRVVLPEHDPRIPVDDATGLPIHGVLPSMLRWELDLQRSPDALSARLVWDRPELLELFPFEHELRLETKVEDHRMTIATTLRPAGKDAVPVSFGYHPYLRIPGASRQSWDVRLGAFRRLILDHRMLPTGQREPVGRRHFELADVSIDDGYDGLAMPAEFEVAGGGLKLTVEFRQGYHFAQVYAPPDRDFICFEPMTAPANALNSGDGLQLAQPGNEYQAAFAIGIRPLDDG
jgi:galactose mutarotase-like enzyme